MPETKTVHIRGGRTMYTDAPACEIHDGNYGDPLFKFDQVELQQHTSRPGGEFMLKVRHENGTDIEHDAAFIAVFEGAGLQFTSVAGAHVDFTGVLLSVRYYEEDFPLVVDQRVQGSDLDRIEMCEPENCRRDETEPHLIMPYMPPFQKFKPRMVDIRMSYRNKKEK